ncbi:MAG: hypothetical protein ACTSV7_03045 [Candidatus Baldrarchaeia archaeon]
MSLSIKRRVWVEEKGWRGVDLDGTLAHYDGWNNGEIGKPIPKMLERIKKWIEDGQEVRIVTARVADGDATAIDQVEDYLENIGIGGLEVTATKDFEMIELWDDRCVQVIPNTGERVDGKE